MSHSPNLGGCAVGREWRAEGSDRYRLFLQCESSPGDVDTPGKRARKREAGFTAVVE
jgi:hypothetical protein